MAARTRGRAHPPQAEEDQAVRQEVSSAAREAASEASSPLKACGDVLTEILFLAARDDLQ